MKDKFTDLLISDPDIFAFSTEINSNIDMVAYAKGKEIKIVLLEDGKILNIFNEMPTAISFMAWSTDNLHLVVGDD